VRHDYQPSSTLINSYQPSSTFINFHQHFSKMNCPNCGHATPPTEAARCGHCNFKLPANPRPQAAKSTAALPCWNCRHPNAAEAERCEHCNAKLQKPKNGNWKLETGHFQTPQTPQTTQTFKHFSSHDQ